MAAILALLLQPSSFAGYALILQGLEGLFPSLAGTGTTFASIFSAVIAVLKSEGPSTGSASSAVASANH